ncbi:6-phosphogluconolactonase [Shewanella colwelliana]|uniref:6-phosphogluconolactonase n=1 Tax=Shewanella colwelliana TaxID=23 RepID=A0A1E5IZ27_SHECO|nr:6-phosphogluconolactonase [Shewanella colwelliana]MDX1282393.1 6-phosphogluconolactonase [Shewanella colwelliana]OEG72249.1 6-phosphogluconolactonase [Shewanella colwelliana]OEG75756.1 6-phosphogluconolactonase [Shewanella colwelliana]GIU31526.1 6-phosphogluconolactonase [Shewanella colwelliana]GIU43328.1 6-phosphogluconolactonase [Shewanella colwelliana]
MIKDSVFKSFDDKTALETQLAERIANQLQTAIDARGKASLVVSGGSTPVALFQQLSKKAIEWSEVYITLADERWVDVDSDDSNEKLVKAHLLQNRAAAAKFRGLKNMFASAEAGADMTIEQLANFPKPFDVVVLGMGNDGHTCSWFPCSLEIEQALSTDSLCLAVNPGNAPHGRITISKQGILASRQIYLHIVGEQKLSVYRQALENEDEKAMPIRAVLAQHSTPVDVYWSA